MIPKTSDAVIRTKKVPDTLYKVFIKRHIIALLGLRQGEDLRIRTPGRFRSYPDDIGPLSS